MDKEFDRAIVMRLGKAFYDVPRIYLDNQPVLQDRSQGVLSLLAELGKDYAIVPLAEYEATHGALNRAIAMLAQFDYCPPTMEGKGCAGPEAAVFNNCEKCWSEWVFAKEATSHV